MKRVIFVLIVGLCLYKSVYADYIVKLNTDVTKFDDTKIECILNDWFLVDSLDNLDIAYVQDNYTYKACEFLSISAKKPIILTNTDMSKIQTMEPKSNTKIAILDTGIDETNGTLRKYVAKSYNPQNKDDNVQDECGHGTHIAGIITNLSNNKIMPVKVLNGNGTGKSSDIAIGIKWAVEEGAKVINLSLGGTKYDQLLKEAIDYATERGCIVVCASGNTYSERKIYPACLPNAISVGSIDKDGNISNFSNRGDSVDVYALGDVISFGLNGEYIEKSGTSMACAIISAELSLIF